MSYYVFRNHVDPNKPHVKRLKDGTVIRGGYETAYDQNAFGANALKWARASAKHVKGKVFKKVNGRYQEVK